MRAKPGRRTGLRIVRRSRARRSNRACRGLRNARLLDDLDVSKKTVSPFGDGLNVSRVAGGITQHVAKFDHSGVEAVIKVNKGVLRPKTQAQLFACNNFFGAFQQRYQHLERLHLQLEPRAATKQLGGISVSLKLVEFVFQRRWHSVPWIRRPCRSLTPQISLPMPQLLNLTMPSLQCPAMDARRQQALGLAVIALLILLLVLLRRLWSGA